VVWSVRDRPAVRVPANEEEWISSGDAAVPLVPPFVKRQIEIDAERSFFGDQDIRAAVVEFATVLADKPKLERKATLRPNDPESTDTVVLYHDRETPVAFRVSWHAAGASQKGELKLLESDYLFLVPPQMTTPDDTESGGG
jgi:hypothetical protein